MFFYWLHDLLYYISLDCPDFRDMKPLYAQRNRTRTIMMRCVFWPEGVALCVVAVVVGVTHSVCGDVQLCEGAQRDSGLLDGVDEAVPRRDRHGVDELLRTPGRVWRQQDVGVQDDPLPLHQMHCLAQQHQVTWRQRGEDFNTQPALPGRVYWEKCLKSENLLRVILQPRLQELNCVNVPLKEAWVRIYHQKLKKIKSSFYSQNCKLIWI